MTDHAGVGHGHTHVTAAGAHRGRLVVVLVLTTTVMVVAVVGGLVSGSVALLADAGHMLTDVGGLALALVATNLAARPATSVRTFGWQRVEVLAAMANAMVVAAVAVVVLVEGARRTADPQPVAAGVMLVAAVAGLVANAVGLGLLRRGQAESLNIRGAYLEVLGDLLGSAAVVVAAVVIATTGFTAADGLASVVIGLLILPRAYGLARQVGRVLLEAVPEHIDLDQVRRHLCDVPGVLGVHDLHVWTITSGVPVLSAHVVVSQDVTTCILDDLHACVSDHFDLAHCTFQVEPPGHAAHEGHTHR